MVFLTLYQFLKKAKLGFSPRAPYDEAIPLHARLACSAKPKAICSAPRMLLERTDGHSLRSFAIEILQHQRKHRSVHMQHKELDLFLAQSEIDYLAHTI